MAQLSPDYKRLFLEERRLREESERAKEEAERAKEEADRAKEDERCRREEAERAREEAEREIEDERRLREEAEQKSRKTTLPEFLNACHIYLHLGLSVQAKELSTQGSPANANNKLRPESIRAWKEFPRQQEAIWDDLMRSDFILERQFTSSNTLKENGDILRQRMMGSEPDLNHFERSTVEDHVSSIIKQLYRNPTLRKKFHLKGSVQFENHANTLTSEARIEEGMQQMSLSRNLPRRSARLLSQAKGIKPLNSTEPAREPAAAAVSSAAKTARPRADQFCVYNTSNGIQNMENRTAAFVIEYKPPHKLTLGYIYEGLNDMELEDVVRCRETEGPQDQFRRLVAAAITQAFSYMVQAGVEYGYVCTGEAFIFLRVPEDPKMVYYFLSVPKGDVGETTGWAPDSDGENRLHLTAVGQVLAFTLQALKTQPRNQNWKADAMTRLKTWEIVYDDILDEASSQDAPSSEYRQPRAGENEYLRMSPVRLRPRRPSSTGSTSCHLQQVQSQSSDDEFDPDTPSRPPQQRQSQLPSQALNPASKVSGHGSRDKGKGKGGQYCTQKCLRGLVEGGLLDRTCPNARDHGDSHHQIDQPTFLNLIHQQLSKDLDTDCMPEGIHGSRGALFRVRLTSHGYTVAAKCTVIELVAHMKQEAAVYEHIRPIQGIHVPMYLGSIDLDRPYYYDGFADIVHMMFFGFGGGLIFQYINTNIWPYLIQQFEHSIRAIHQLGVLHRDVMPRNMLWNAEAGQAMIIDFERAEILGRRTALGIISPNRKRKRIPEGHLYKQVDRFEPEVRRAMAELRALS